MRKSPMIASMVAILAVGFVGIAAAQAPTTQSEEPANCGLCRHNLSTNEHWFNGSCSGAGSDCFDCKAFNSCHTNPQTPYTCSVSHWECASGLAALGAVDKAMRDPSPGAAIFSVARMMPKNVEVVATGYILVRGCNGSIVAAYKAPRDVSVFLAIRIRPSHRGEFESMFVGMKQMPVHS